MSMLDSIHDRLHSSKRNKSLLKKYFTPPIVGPIHDLATPTYDSNFGHCIFTGVSLLDSVIGVNAPDPEAYTTFAPLFDAIIKDYHKFKPKEEIQHPASYFGSVTNLNYSDLDPEGQYIVATRVQINRCLQGYGFANILTPEIRVELETKSKEALSSLTGDLGGSYYPVDSLCRQLRDELARENLLFNDSDRFLQTNGVYKDWPTSRGMYVNDSRNFVAWVNGEDHLKLISAQKGTDIGKPYQQMVNAVKMLERKLSFVKDHRLGYLTYCPTNVGTGLHAIIHIKVPHLADKKNFNSICEKLNLKVEDLQKVPVEGVETVHAVSNIRTVGITEIEIMEGTMSSVKELIQLEKDAAEGKDKCIVT